VLNRLVGTWSVQNEQVMPEGPTEHGTVRYEWIADEKFLRAYTRYDAAATETLTVFRYDAEDKGFRRWFFSSTSGLPSIQGPAEGKWDARAATLTWRGTLPLSHKVVHEDHWIDADNFETRTEIKHHQGTVVLRQTKKMHRFIETESIFDNRKDYSLIGWDEFRRVYRVWHFGADGDITEAEGTWDKNEKKLTWKSPDGRFTSAWTMPNENEHHAVVAFKGPQGRRLYEVVAVSRRAGGK
jgi:hypothetical protein